MGASTHRRSKDAVTVRALRSDDRERWLELLRSMSWATRYLRGARFVERLTPEEIDRAVNLDPENEVAFVAVTESVSATGTMAGIVRATQTAPGRWTFTLVVLDGFQRSGLGRRLMDAVRDDLRARRATLLQGEVLASNRGMLDFVRKLGFLVHAKGGDEITCRISLSLASD